MTGREPELDVAGLRIAGPPAHSIEGEAMRRRIGARLFGGTVEPLRIGRFRVQRSIGQGGMGVVYAAEDDTLGRVVALKVIRPDAGASRPRERQRLLDEARALARLAHPNVISIYEVGEHGDEIFIAMEHVRGCTLLQWLKTPRTRAEIVAQFAAAGRGLAAAHAVGLVHRDFKPGNVLVGEDGRARIVDFGLARGPRARSLQEAAISEPDSTPVSEEPVPATEPRAGTPGYMSPEQALGQGCDARSDQFSFCVALHEALYGRRPFRKDVVAALVRQDVLRPPARGERGRVPGWLRRVLTRGLAFAPEARFASMDALLAALDRGSRSRAWLLAGAAGLAAAAGFVSVALQGQDMCPSADQALLATWGPERREAVRRAFQATQPPERAEAAWAELARSVDRYAGAWKQASREACEATQLRRTATERSLYARRLCLEERRQELANVVGLLERREPALADGARELIAWLRPIEGCQGPAASAALKIADGRRERARHDLKLARTWQQAGRLEEAQRRLAGLQVEARGLGDLGLELEVMLLRGSIEGRERKDAAAAEEMLLRAAIQVNQLGPTPLAADIWNEYALVAARLTDDEPRARERLGFAMGLAGPRPDGLQQAAWLETGSYIERLAGRPALAERRARDALEQRQKLQPPSHPEVARTRMLVANALADQDQPAQAEELLRTVLGEQVAALGESHPSLLDIAHSLALVQIDREEFAAAEQTLLRARAVAADLFGASSVRVAAIDVHLAIATRADAAAAISRLRAAIQVLTAHGERDSQERILALQELADLLLTTQDYRVGLEVNRELLALHDRGASLEIESVLVNIGDYLCLLDRCPEALEPYARLLARPANLPGAEALPMQGLGRVYLARGQPRTALPLLEQAREIFIRTPRPTRHMLEQTTRMIAECLSLLGEQRRAKEMLAEADRLQAALGPE